MGCDFEEKKNYYDILDNKRKEKNIRMFQSRSSPLKPQKFFQCLKYYNTKALVIYDVSMVNIKFIEKNILEILKH